MPEEKEDLPLYRFKVKIGKPLPGYRFKPGECIVNSKHAEEFRQRKCTQEQVDGVKMLVLEVGIDEKAGKESYRLLYDSPTKIGADLPWGKMTTLPYLKASKRGQLLYKPALEPPACTTSSTNAAQLCGRMSQRHFLSISSPSRFLAPSGFGRCTEYRVISVFLFSFK
jgi:hypothetical protein